MIVQFEFIHNARFYIRTFSVCVCVCGDVISLLLHPRGDGVGQI